MRARTSKYMSDIEGQNECQKRCQKECRKQCQTECHSKCSISLNMPEKMSGKMPENRCHIYFQNLPDDTSFLPCFPSAQFFLAHMGLGIWVVLPFLGHGADRLFFQSCNQFKTGRKWLTCTGGLEHSICHRDALVMPSLSKTNIVSKIHWMDLGQARIPDSSGYSAAWKSSFRPRPKVSVRDRRDDRRINYPIFVSAGHARKQAWKILNRYFFFCFWLISLKYCLSWFCHVEKHLQLGFLVVPVSWSVPEVGFKVLARQNIFAHAEALALFCVTISDFFWNLKIS